MYRVTSLIKKWKINKNLFSRIEKKPKIKKYIIQSLLFFVVRILYAGYP